jgi:hypothetical protein
MGGNSLPKPRLGWRSGGAPDGLADCFRKNFLPKSAWPFCVRLAILRHAWHNRGHRIARVRDQQNLTLFAAAGRRPRDSAMVLACE